MSASGRPIAEPALAAATANPPPAAEPMSAVSDVAVDHPAVEVAAEVPRPIPDSAAPWRRMLPLIRPLRQLPIRGIDSLPPGEHPPI